MPYFKQSLLSTVVKGKQKGFAHILILVLLLAGIGLGIYLVQTKTNILPRAASGPIAPRTAFSFQGNTQSVKVGEQFSLDVMVSSDFDAANTFTAKVVYDPSKLEVAKINPGITDTASSSGYFIKKWIEQTSDNNGNILLSGAVPNPGYKTTAGNPGKMATVIFKAKAAGGAAIGYNFNDSAIYRNSDNQNILTATDGWSMTIGPASSGIPAVDTDGDGFLDGDELFFGTDPVKACGANAWPPDLNDDTFVNGGDVSFLVPYTSGTKPYSKRYDLNRDGGINDADVVVIQKYFLKSCSISGPSPSPSGSLCRSIFCTEALPPAGCQLKAIFTSTCNPAEYSKLTCGKMVCSSATPSSTPLPTINGKRADLFKDTKKPNFVNDQDISVFFTKCAEKGVELFGQAATVQPVCDIFEDGKITVQDWAVLIKFRNQAI